MVLTFSPSIRTCTVLPILPNGSGTYRFTASFPNREQYEQARREGTRVEMWTNLPVGDKINVWHALPFTFAEDAAAEGAPEDKLISLLSPTSVAARQQLVTVTLDVSLTSIRPGLLYSFTYRIVRPWGAVIWQGAYGQNGDLVFEEKDVRFTLADGCKIEDNTIVSSATEPGSVVVATLNNAINWACWGFSANGCVILPFCLAGCLTFHACLQMHGTVC